MSSCSICHNTFSRHDAMLRHKRHTHGPDQLAPALNHDPDQLAPALNHEDPSNKFEFQHPCSIVISGPSGSGKSVLTKNILCKDWIQPSPQRIIWSYGQYQPLYDTIQRELPRVEFVKGIPEFLELDSYLDTSVQNCLILDDLMGDAKKDERIANLFTRGSHHRNLTVLYLTQNVFPQGKACRDVALNTKYLILFNNPVDRNQVLNIARRIYPNNSQFFMNTYQRAIEQPYGYLLIDMRANTSEHERLRPNALTDTNQPRAIEHTTLKRKSEDKDNNKGQKRKLEDLPSCDGCGAIYSVEADLKTHEHKCYKMPSCEECGKLFETPEDVDNHTDLMHNDTDSLDDWEPEQSLQMTDKTLYFKWISSIVRNTWDDQIEKAEEELGSENKAINSLLLNIQKTVRHTITDLLIDIMKMRKDVLYQTLMRTAESLVKTNRLTTESAIRYAVKMHKDELGDVFMPRRDESESDDTDDDENNIEE